VIDVIDLRLAIGQPDQILDDLDDIFLGQCFLAQRIVQVQFPVDLVPAYLAEIIPLVREE
jgi:hypothetical protein